MLDLNRKVIFTHPPKCAGTTVEGLFGWHPSKYKGEDSRAYFEYFRKWKHASLENHLAELHLMGEDASNYFVFSCIRNPWDRAVSWYHWRVKELARFKRNHPDEEPSERLRAILEASFEEFVIQDYKRVKGGRVNLLATSPFILSASGRKPDFIIRHENYLEGLRFVAEKFGLDADTAVPFNADVRPKEPHYREYYTSEQSISIVAEMAKDSIEEFGYEF